MKTPSAAASEAVKNGTIAACQFLSLKSSLARLADPGQRKLEAGKFAETLTFGGAMIQPISMPHKPCLMTLPKLPLSRICSLLALATRWVEEHPKEWVEGSTSPPRASTAKMASISLTPTASSTARPTGTM